MKRKLTFALCAVMMLAGFFGLQAVSESGLQLLEALGAILLICVLELPFIRLANKTVAR